MIDILHLRDRTSLALNRTTVLLKFCATAVVGCDRPCVYKALFKILRFLRKA
ncbi:hypothetical protein JYQ62_23460 [Nostoc sp. UHCC 0702]|nr:hypothetical protein JYQ62_23460 [Nostoc sp. UHCC 0702]